MLDPDSPFDFYDLPSIGDMWSRLEQIEAQFLDIDDANVRDMCFYFLKIHYTLLDQHGSNPEIPIAIEKTLKSLMSCLIFDSRRVIINSKPQVYFLTGEERKLIKTQVFILAQQFLLTPLGRSHTDEFWENIANFFGNF
jgi:hypothetical protein